MICPNCGTQNPDGSFFCINCGTKFGGQPNSAPFNVAAFAHPDDIKALNALKSIPGFSMLLKTFFKYFNEREFFILNMSSKLRLSENQMPEIYNMLPPICEKFGIPVPELYMDLEVVPNAYTFGDNNPFIVINSGLLDNMPKELIPTVIAHECGHIACHHTLYHTMGRMIFDGTLAAIDSLGVSRLITLPLKMAFFYWMRCSEYSADRAAIVYDASAEKIVEMCMRFSGLKGETISEQNKALFVQQGIDYKRYVQESGWNKTLEFLLLFNQTHPFNSIRALEAKRWSDSQQFYDASRLMGTSDKAFSDENNQE